ncbi:MAG: tRNA (N6-threonylcarbamoyladenosine(37)-N6)-methyltransferase TrmO [Clostridium sp.]|nr:tRNA (N6-threonylcarbamoyladenosine(37)-N6)-methyltransferase TrmO [Acetatifactor muris]MCM1564135.1 tRNA (N6-threonylcarbamoyladenosine(37)-N6)-methyltransferase TrmO [Clostridium sp.]
MADTGTDGIGAADTGTERRLRVIARIHTEFPAKFGIPRQSGLVEELRGEIVLEPEYRRPEALYGIEEFSHLWLLWDFSEARRENWSATVAPPRLGGREKRGVFATRSPFRPNSIGLSCVRLQEVCWEGEDCPKLIVAGADLMDGTPIYDIKPYLPYADAHPEASGGFGQAHSGDGIEVEFPEELLHRLPEEKRRAALQVLQQDPRAAYHKKPDYVYGMEFAGFDIRFTVENDVLLVRDVISTAGQDWENIK